MADDSYVPAGLKCSFCGHRKGMKGGPEDLVWAGKGKMAICRHCADVIDEIFSAGTGPGNTGPKVKKRAAAGTTPDQGDRPAKPPTV